MDITPFVPAGRQVIQSYGAGAFTINGIRHQGSMLVFAERCVAWPVTESGDIGWDQLAGLAEESPRPDLLLIGTGDRLRPIDPALKLRLRQSGIMVEAMDTGAACRTFNVLMAEERRVAAAVIAVP